MITSAIKLARQRRMHRISLQVVSGNNRAVALYEKWVLWLKVFSEVPSSMTKECIMIC